MSKDTAKQVRDAEKRVRGKDVHTTPCSDSEGFILLAERLIKEMKTLIRKVKDDGDKTPIALQWSTFRDLKPVWDDVYVGQPPDGYAQRGPVVTEFTLLDYRQSGTRV